MSILDGLGSFYVGTDEVVALDDVRESLLNPPGDTVNAVASRAWAAGHYVSPSVVRAVLAAAAGGDQ